jgi:hypothetical protein
MTYNELVTAVQDYCENTFSTVDMNTFIRQAEQRIYNTAQPSNLRKNMTGVLASGNKYLSTPEDFLSAYSLAVIDASGNYTYLINKDVNFIREAYPKPSSTGLPKHYAIFGPTTSGSTITNELTLILGPTPNASYNVELHFYYYPESIVQTPVTTLGTVTGGSAYTNGTYLNVPLTGGSGSGAVANVVVSGNAVTSVVLVQGGTGFVVGNTLSASASSIGGTGSGFSVPVSAVGNALGTSWLGDNFDSVLLYGTMCEALTYMKGEADMLKLYQERYVQAIALYKNLADGKQRADAYRDGQVRIAVS